MESSQGKGTVVTMLLPWNKEPTTSSNILSERKTPSQNPVATVLLVDDEDLVRKSGKRQLMKLGYDVLLAKNGLDALRIFSEKKDSITAVILDIMMPVMDGEETLEKLKSVESELPVLLASGFSKEEKAEELLTKGADGFIQKPFDLKNLKQSMEKLLNPEPISD